MPLERLAQLSVRGVPKTDGVVSPAPRAGECPPIGTEHNAHYTAPMLVIFLASLPVAAFHSIIVPSLLPLAIVLPLLLIATQ